MAEGAAEGEDGGGDDRRRPCDDEPSSHRYGCVGKGTPFVLSKPLNGSATYGNDVLVRHVVRVDAVAERQAVPDQHTADRALGDVDHVVLEPPAVRIAGKVAAEHAEPVDLADASRRGDRQVEPELVRERRSGVVQRRRLEPGAEHCHEVVTAVSLNGPNCGYSFCSTVARIGFCSTSRTACPSTGADCSSSPSGRRDDDLVDQRVAEARDLHPLPLPLALAVADADLLPVGGRPDADRVVLRRCRAATSGSAARSSARRSRARKSRPPPVAPVP